MTSPVNAGQDESGGWVKAMTLMEEELRVLDELKRTAGVDAKCVEAGPFQDLLERCGVPLGSRAADDIVLQCKVLEDGSIDFSEFEANVRSRPFAAPASAPASAPAPAAAASQAPDKVARPILRPPVPPPALEVDVAAELPAHGKDRVMRATAQLRDAFTRFDTGRIDVQGLRRSVQALGLEETPAFTSLLRSAPMDMTFSQLFQALLQVTETPSGALSGKAAHLSALASTTRSTDVITWRTEPTGSRVAPVLASPSARESVDSPWNVNPGSPMARGVYTVRSPTRRGKKIDADKTNHSSINLDTPGVPHDAPATGAGFLKEQIYTCIRNLDQGIVTADEFQLQMAHLGVTMPPEARRLLAHAREVGEVNFQHFALAFDHVIKARQAHQMEELERRMEAARLEEAKRAQEDSAARALGAGPQADPEPTTAPRRRPVLACKAQGTHGDLIAWSERPGELEKAELEERNHHQRRHVSGTAQPYASQDHVDLTWSESPPPPPESGGHHARRHGYSARDHLGSTNILTWEGSKQQEDGRGKPGRRTVVPAQHSLSYPFGVESKPQ